MCVVGPGRIRQVKPGDKKLDLKKRSEKVFANTVMRIEKSLIKDRNKKYLFNYA